MEVDFFKAEHAALLDLRRQLLDVLDGAADPDLARSLLGMMNRILLSHLVKEDEHLYPHLKRNPLAAPVAEQFERELGGLALAWRTLMTGWPVERIATDWQGLNVAARPLFDLLEERARREEEELYPLLSARQQDAA